MASTLLVGRALSLLLLVREAGRDGRVPVGIVEYQLLWGGESDCLWLYFKLLDEKSTGFSKINCYYN